jgi:hypothetical protein
VRWTLLACAVIAALSLLVLHEATYDPTAWLIWGRQIAHGTLETVAGPTWKPLPVAFTVPFSLAGDDGAMSLWLLVARVGGLMSLVLAYRVASRVAGRAAGVIAAAALLLAAEYTLNWLRGNSEGLLVLCSLLAVDRHLAGHRRQAFLSAAAAGLLRPDVWPLLAAYGLWLLWQRRDARTGVLVLGGGAFVALCWFVPEYIGSGDFFRGVSRAQEPVPGSPGASESPFLETFSNASQSLSYGVYAGALLALGLAWRDRRVLALGCATAALMLVVAFGASGAGFTGSLRYVALPASLVCVLAGIGWSRLAQRVPAPRPAVLAVALLAAVPGLLGPVDRLGGDLAHAHDTDRRLAALPGFIDRAGGRDAVLGCGQLYTGPFSTQVLAYVLGLRQQEVALNPRPPGTILERRDSPLAGTPGFSVKLESTEWMLQSTC